MMNHRTRLLMCALFLALCRVQLAAAHGHTTVGDYELEIGFHNEPAYQGQPNGLDLFVTNARTGAKVNGLEETLKAEISFGTAKRELVIEPQWDQEGAYSAHVLPTEVGDYTWRIFGTIEGTPVDISMTSGPDTFGSVEPISAVAFPGSDAPEQIAAQNAAQGARSALLAGIAGIVLGLLGLIVGLLGLRGRRASQVQLTRPAR